jgi:hypothetical protein
VSVMKYFLLKNDKLCFLSITNYKKYKLSMFITIKDYTTLNIRITLNFNYILMKRI